MDLEKKTKKQFTEFNRRFFDNKLAQVVLEFSDKMKVSAGMFYPPSKVSSSPRIRLNRQMLSIRNDEEVIATLLHEMIHAFLHITKGKLAKPHGDEFKQKCGEINKALSITISTKHNYITWYRCDRVCMNFESSLFGYMSRACHDRPDPAGSGKHQRVCGGTYRETEEPPKDLLKKIKKCGKEIKLKARKKKLAAKQSNVQHCALPISTQTSSNYIDYLTSDDEA